MSPSHQKFEHTSTRHRYAQGVDSSNIVASRRRFVRGLSASLQGKRRAKKRAKNELSAIFGEDAVDVTIGAGATLEEVRDAINASGAQVSASILNIGSGSQLQITSLQMIRTQFDQ